MILDGNLTAALLAGAILSPVALALALIPLRSRRRIASLAPLGALPALGLALFGAPGGALQIPWLLKHTVLVLDETGKVFLGFTSALYLAATWYARSYLRRDPHPVRFLAFLLAAMAGNFCLITAGDVPTFYLGFAVMGLASAGLVAHRGDSEAVRAARLYLALAMIGEVLIFTGLVFLVVNARSTDIAVLRRSVPGGVPLALLLVGFGIKAGALTLHFWLPLAHPAAPVPASAVLSGAMIKAGLLGWLRFLPLGEATVTASGVVFLGAGLAAAFLGTVVGTVQRNPKTVLAYSSISQMGIIMTGLGLGALRPDVWPEIRIAVLIYATHHALSKGALFLAVGPAEGARTRLQRIAARLGLLLPALALAGAPFTSGALAKVALKSRIGFLPGVWADVLGILLPLAAVGTTLKMARFLHLTWPRGATGSECGAAGLWLPWLFLVSAVPVGVWLLPGALETLPIKLEPEKLWLAIWPLLAGGSLAILGARLRRKLSGDPTRWLPPGDVGIVLARLLTRVATRASPSSPSDRAAGDDVGSAAGRPRLRAWSGALRKRAGEAERRMRHWPLVGLFLVLCVLLLLSALAIGGRAHETEGRHSRGGPAVEDARDEASGWW